MRPPAHSRNSTPFLNSKRPSATIVKVAEITTAEGIALVHGEPVGPAFSPDNKRIRFTVSLWELLLYDFQSGKWSEWTTEPDAGGYPAWSSDSRSLDYWSANRIKRVKLGESRSQDLFNFATMPVYFTPEFGLGTTAHPTVRECSCATQARKIFMRST